jgi:hypothetical protein
MDLLPVEYAVVLTRKSDIDQGDAVVQFLVILFSGDTPSSKKKFLKLNLLYEFLIVVNCPHFLYWSVMTKKKIIITKPWL